MPRLPRSDPDESGGAPSPEAPAASRDPGRGGASRLAFVGVDHPPFFQPTDAGLEPHPDAHSPWSTDMLHGRLLVGLAAWAVERAHGDPDMQPARLTVDLFRSPAMAITTVQTRLVRDGRRVRIAEAVLAAGGVEVARASVLSLRRAEAPADDAPTTGAWDAPSPDAAPPGPVAGMPFEVRPAGPRGFGAPGPAPRRVWVRETRALVAGDELSPFTRVALAADFASPLANMSGHGLDYINADVTLHVARLPAGEWVGIATDDRVAAAGISVAQCVYHDRQGPLGFSTTSAVLTGRMATGGR